MNIATSLLGLKKSTLLRSSQAQYRDLIRTQTLEPDTLHGLQRDRAMSHARFAMANTQYYRQRYQDAGLTLEDLRDPDAFESLPIIEKDDVREHFDMFKSTEASAKNSRISATGGSTGQPLKLLRDLRFQARALEWRLFDWWGISPADNIAVVYRVFRSSKQTKLQELLWWPAKRIQLNAFEMSDATIDAFLSDWNRNPPALVIGYVGGVAELARNIEERALPLHLPKAAAVTAAAFHPAQRRQIESVFHAPAYDHYRCAEVPWMAGECRQRNGLHVFSDVRVLELLDSNNTPVEADEVGEVVVSDLTNRVFPLIRYRLGDRTSWMSGACECGVTLPRIAPIRGRVSEMIKLPDSTMVAGEGLTTIFSHFSDSVRQYQLHQSSDYSITIKCVPGISPDYQVAMDQVVDRIRNMTKGQLDVRLEIVESIPHIGGKLRFISSDLV